MNATTLPSWEEAQELVLGSCPGVLHIFIYDNEPSGAEDEQDFRSALDGVIKSINLSDEEISSIADNFKFKDHYRSNEEAIQFAKKILATALNKTLEPVK